MKATAENERLDRIFKALAHPTRRDILRDVSRRDRTVLEIAERHPMSLNGVSKHLKVLEAAGLVDRRVQGTNHFISLQARPLLQASRWLHHYEEFWDHSLQGMKAFVENG